MSMLVVSQPCDQHLRPIGWSGRDVAKLYHQFKRVLAAHPDAAMLLAEPVGDGGTMDYYTSDYREKIAFADLDDTQRTALIQRMEQATQFIEQVIVNNSKQNDDALAHNLARTLTDVFYIPDSSYLYSIDGHPVIAFWGYGLEYSKLDIRTLKEQYTPPLPPSPPAKKRWLKYLLIILLLLLLAAGLYYLYLTLWKNYPPIARADHATLSAEVTQVDLPILHNDSDPNPDDTLNITSCNDAALDIIGDQVRYRRRDGVTGVQSFSCTISDNHGLTDTAALTIDVARRPPQVNDDYATLGELETQSEPIKILDNDRAPEGDRLQIKDCQPTQNVAINHDSVVYQRSTGVDGTVIVQCSIMDSTGLKAVSKLIIEVEPAKDCTPIEVTSYGSKYDAPHVILAVDTSGSMSGTIPSNRGKTRWAVTLQAIAQLFNATAPEIDFTLLALNNKIDIFTGSRQDMLNALERYDINNIGLSFELAFAYLDEQLKQHPEQSYVFIMITDADDTPLEGQIEIVRHIQSSYDEQRIVMNVIRIIPGRGDYDQFKTNNGINITLDSMQALESTLQKTVKYKKPPGC